MANSVCAILRAAKDANQQSRQRVQVMQQALDDTRAALDLVGQAIDQALIDAGCDDPAGQAPSDEEPTLPGFDADLGMGEPSDVPKAYEPPKE